MENKKLIALRYLLEKSMYKEIQHSIYNAEVLKDYHFFKMERENFLFVFGRRLKNNKTKGVYIKGLEDTIKEFEKSDFSVILSHSLEVDRKPVLIYTDEEMTRIFGVVEPTNWNP
jgi:hypothetical protein